MCRARLLGLLHFTRRPNTEKKLWSPLNPPRSSTLGLCLSVCPSVCLPVCPYVHLSSCLSVQPSVCPSVCLSVCPSVLSFLYFYFVRQMKTPQLSDWNFPFLQCKQETGSWSRRLLWGAPTDDSRLVSSRLVSACSSINCAIRYHFPPRHTFIRLFSVQEAAGEWTASAFKEKIPAARQK